MTRELYEQLAVYREQLDMHLGKSTGLSDLGLWSGEWVSSQLTPCSSKEIPLRSRS
jgi:hypothetical protein